MHNIQDTLLRHILGCLLLKILSVTRPTLPLYLTHTDLNNQVLVERLFAFSRLLRVVRLLLDCLPFVVVLVVDVKGGGDGETARPR